MKRPFDERPPAACPHFRPGLPRRLDMALDLAEMIRGDDRADPGLGIERIADLHGLRPLGEPGEELVRDLRVQEQARSRIAAFAGVEIGAEGRGVEGGVQVGVGEDHLRILAAELHRDLLQGLRRRRPSRPVRPRSNR